MYARISAAAAAAATSQQRFFPFSSLLLLLTIITHLHVQSVYNRWFVRSFVYGIRRSRNARCFFAVVVVFCEGVRPTRPLQSLRPYKKTLYLLFSALVVAVVRGSGGRSVESHPYANALPANDGRRLLKVVDSSLRTIEQTILVHTSVVVVVVLKLFFGLLLFVC